MTSQRQFMKDCKYRIESRLGMSVTTQGGSGRQYVTGPRRNISKYRLVLLNVYEPQSVKTSLNDKVDKI